MKLSLVTLLVLPTVATAAATAYSVYFASGTCNHVTFEGHFEVGRADYDASGSVLRMENLTHIDAFMMGYIRVSPDQKQVLYAAQTQEGGQVANNVVLYRLSLEAKAPPAPLLPDLSALLHPCANAEPIPCTQADTFHPYWDDTGDDTGLIAFAYRAWTPDGFPSGNQALAMLHPDGSIHPLTFNTTEIQTSDGCPRFVPGSNGTQLIFKREVEGGAVIHMAHLDVPTGVVTILPGLPPDGWGGCPATLSHRREFLYVSEDPVMEVIAVESLTPFKVKVSEAFAVPRINTTGAVDVLGMQYCSHVNGMEDTVACKAGPDYDIVSVLNAQTGRIAANLTVPLPEIDAWDLTANSFHVWRVGN